MGRKLFMFFSFMIISLVLAACSGDETATNETANNSGSNESSNEDTSSEEVFEMDVNNFQPSTHHYGYNVFEPWKQIVEEKTDGRVKVNLHHGASIGKSSSVYQDLTGGLYDVSFVNVAYFYDTPWFPYTIANLPFAFEGPEEMGKIMQEFGEKYANDDLDDVIIMPPSSTDAYDLFATEPIRSVDDLNGLKMRVSGKNENALVEGLGGVPVSLSTEDVYEGLDKGMINTSFYTPIGAVGLAFYEPAPYITKLSVSVSPLIPAMNKDFFNSLPEDLQTLFEEELNPELSKLLTESYVELLEESYGELEEAIKDSGEVIELSDKDVQEFRTIGKAAWDAWIEDANEKGYNGQEMVDDFFNMLEAEGYPLPY